MLKMIRSSKVLTFRTLRVNNDRIVDSDDELIGKSSKSKFIGGMEELSFLDFASQPTSDSNLRFE